MTSHTLRAQSLRRLYGKAGELLQSEGRRTHWMYYTGQSPLVAGLEIAMYTKLFQRAKDFKFQVSVSERSSTVSATGDSRRRRPQSPACLSYIEVSSLDQPLGTGSSGWNMTHLTSAALSFGVCGAF